MIIGIVAIAQNFAIGKDGKLPWHYPADLRFFKETTTGNAVVMGSNTWRAIGKTLPNRLNVVLTRTDKTDGPSEIMFLNDEHEVLDLARYINRDVYIIGGARTYETFADSIDQWVVTYIPTAIDNADTFMPENFLDGFEPARTRELEDGLVVKTLRRMTG